MRRNSVRAGSGPASVAPAQARLWSWARAILLALLVAWFSYALLWFAHALLHPTPTPPDITANPSAFNSYAEAICRGAPDPYPSLHTIAITCNGP
jgi:hypothetical protein